MVAHNCHHKTKSLTAKTKTSRQNQKPHGKNKYLTAKRNTSQQKQNSFGFAVGICFCREVLWFCGDICGPLLTKRLQRFMNSALQYSRTQSGQIENLLEAKNSSISAVEISSNNSPYSGCFHVKPVSNNRSPKLRRPNSHLERCLLSQSHKEEKHHPNRQSTYDTEESSNGRRIPASLVRCPIDYYNITKVNRAL